MKIATSISEAYLEPCQTPDTKFFVEIVNNPTSG